MAIIRVTGREGDGKQLPFVVDTEMELTAVFIRMCPFLGRGEVCLRPGSRVLTRGRSQGSPLHKTRTSAICSKEEEPAQ